MKIDWITFLRSFVRPYANYLVITMLVSLSIYFAVKYGDAEMARFVVSGVVGAGLLGLGEWLGERASKRKEDK